MASEPTVLNTSCSLLTTGIRASMMRIPSDEAGVFRVRQRFRFDEDRDESGDGVGSFVDGGRGSVFLATLQLIFHTQENCSRESTRRKSTDCSKMGDSRFGDG